MNSKKGNCFSKARNDFYSKETISYRVSHLPGSSYVRTAAGTLGFAWESVHIASTASIDEPDALSSSHLETPARHVGSAHPAIQLHCAGIHLG